jgi:hypothetical protein
MSLQKHLKSPVWAGIALLVILVISRLPQESATETWREQNPAHQTPSAENLTSAQRLEVCERFTKWLDSASFVSGQPPAAEVMAMVRERRAVMEELIVRDPRQALEQAVSLDEWQALPQELQAEIEEPFSALARYSVRPVCGNGSTDAVRYTEIAGGSTLETYVFGSRLGISSKEKAPVQGIRLGSRAALREGSFHVLTAEEAAVAGGIYPFASAGTDFATGAALGEAPITALAGGKIFQFTDRAGYEAFSTAIAKLDENPSPHGGSGLVFLPFPAEGGGFDLEGAVAMNAQYASTWTETKKKVFMIRCDFSDKTDAVFPVVAAGTYATLLNTTISDAIKDFSIWQDLDRSERLQLRHPAAPDRRLLRRASQRIEP